MLDGCSASCAFAAIGLAASAISARRTGQRQYLLRLMTIDPHLERAFWRGSGPWLGSVPRPAYTRKRISQQAGSQNRLASVGPADRYIRDLCVFQPGIGHADSDFSVNLVQAP